MTQPACIEVEGDPDDEVWGPCISVAEWKLMYLRGLTVEQISRHCRVPEKRVRRVIGHFRKRHPELAGARLVLNDRPAPPTDADLIRKPPRPSWDARLAEAKEFKRRRCRPPRVLSQDPAEKALAGWIAGQRKQVRRGTLAVERQELLNTALGDWTEQPRLSAEADLWDQRLVEVIDWITKTGRTPRFSKGNDRFENTLATWLVTQRGLHRRDTLDPDRREHLDQRLPGWTVARR